MYSQLRYLRRLPLIYKIKAEELMYHDSHDGAIL